MPLEELEPPFSKAMNKKFFFITGAVAALVWSATLIYFYASGRIEKYVTETFQVQALVGGIALGIIALFNLLTISEKATCGHDHSDDDEHDHDHDCGHNHKEGESCGHDHGHDHSHGEDVDAHHHEQETASGMTINYAILLLPVIAAVILTPDAMSASWIKNNATLAQPGEVSEDMALTSRKKKQEDSMAPSEREVPREKTDGAADPAVDPYAFTEADLDNLVDKNDRGEYVITVPEIFYTGGDEALQKVLEGKPVETTGQAMEETANNPDGKRMRIFRLYMECCAADARPLSVPVDFPEGLPEFKEMRWYTVHGTMTFEQSNGYTVPVIKGAKLVETEPEGDSPFYDKNGQ